MLSADQGLSFGTRSALPCATRARAGRLEHAQLAFEKMLTYANHLGLYSDQIGPSASCSATSPKRSPTSA